MKILPMVTSGEVFMHTDGSVEMTPMQVIASEDGMMIRIGLNIFFFDKDGKYSGSEMHLPKHSPYASPDGIEAINDMLSQAAKNIGKAPETAYFQPGTDGWIDETDGWPESSRPAMPDEVSQPVRIDVSPRKQPKEKN